MDLKWAFSLINKGTEENHKFWELRVFLNNYSYFNEGTNLMSLTTLIVFINLNPS